MNINIRGYAPVVIDDALLRSNPAAFSAETSYVARLAAELKKPSYLHGRLPAKLICLEYLKATVGPVTSYAEPMAGVGLSARILGGGDLYLNDIAQNCRDVLKNNFQCLPTGDDINDCAFKCGELTFLDFNNFTLSKWLKGAWADVITHATINTGEYLIINDCTPFYFRYGATAFATYSKTLQEPIHTIPEYFYAAAVAWHTRTEWYLQQVAYFRDSSFQLFGRYPVNEIQIDLVTEPPSIVEVS